MFLRKSPISCWLDIQHLTVAQVFPAPGKQAARAVEMSGSFRLALASDVAFSMA
jgi:hypothetical protein